VINSPSGRIPEKDSIRIAEEQRLVAAEKMFRMSLCWFWDLWEFKGLELGQTGVRGAHKRGAPPRGMPCEIVALPYVFWPPPETSIVPSG
jgi:hypothetical protein